MAEPDEDADGDTIPRSRLRAAWDQPEEQAPLRVHDAPERARAAVRHTGPSLEQRIAPWAVPAAPTSGGTAEEPAPGEPADPTPGGRHERRERREASGTRADRHAVYAPPEGAVDLAPSRPTPLTDPPRRRLWPWSRPRR